jgi:hypothetical protein
MDEARYTPPKAVVDDVDADLAAGHSVPDAVLKKIRNAWIACLVSSGITTLLILLKLSGHGGGPFSAIDGIDVLFVLGMALGISRKSRVCAVLMFCYFVLSKYLLMKATGQAGGLLVGAVFLYFYAMGAVGTFEYHKPVRKG